MLVVLSAEAFGHGRGQRHAAAVLADGATQDADRVVLGAPRGVVPAFDGDGGEVRGVARDRVRPGFGGQAMDGRLELSAWWRAR